MKAKSVEDLSTFTWMTRVVVVGVAALPLSVISVALFPGFFFTICSTLPGHINYQAFSIMLVGAVWSIIILAARSANGDSLPTRQLWVDSLVGGFLASLVMGSTLYAVNMAWLLFVGRSFV